MYVAKATRQRAYLAVVLALVMLVTSFCFCLPQAQAAEDTEAPTWPEDSQLTCSNVSEKGVTLTWSAATDNYLVTAYKVYLNEQELATVEGTVNTYDVVDLTGNTSYTFKVEAGDDCNNWSNNGPSFTVTTALDITPPVLTADTSDNILSEGNIAGNADVSTEAKDDEIAVNATGELEATLTQTIGGGGAGGGGGGCLSRLAAGANHTLVVSNGEVWATGYNSSGQLGDGTNENSAAPVKVQDLDNIIAVAAGSEHSMALQAGGTVWSWGRNHKGQLGEGSTANSNKPVQVQQLTGVKDIEAGSDFSIALKDDGTVWAWGYNRRGQLGNGTSTDSNTPVQVQNLTNIIAIAAGSEHSIALKDDGTVWAWGRNRDKQLGNDTVGDQSTVPVQVAELGVIVKISAGKAHNIAIKNDGTIWGWGSNGKGQLGDGTTTSQPLPIKIEALDKVVVISAGAEHTLALKEDGTLLAWGNNSYGQLGDSTNTTSPSPIAVKDITGIMEIAGGDNHCIALKNDNTLWAWGRNYYGQLGNGTTADSNIPVCTYKVLSPRMLVATTNPSKDAQNIRIDSNIEVTFSKNVDLSTVENKVILTRTEEPDKPLGVTIACESNKLVITPEQKLDYDTGYTVTVKQGIAEAEVPSNILESDENWNFNTERLILITYPYGLADKPTGGIELDEKTFIVRFFKSIDPASLEQSNSIILNKIGTLGNPEGEQVSLPFSYELDNEINSLEITANENLEYGTYYELILAAGIKDSEGNATVKDTKVVFYTISMVSEYQIIQDGKPVTAVKPDQTYDLVATITNKSDNTETATVILQVRGGKGAREEQGGYVVGLPYRTEITVESGASAEVSMTFYTDPETIEPAWKDDIYGDIMVMDMGRYVPKAVTGHFTFPIDKSGLTAPVLQADPNAVVEKDVIITFPDDPTWRSALLTFSVTVDGETLPSEKYEVTEGKITIKMGVFTQARDYEIVVEALGYSDARVTQRINRPITEEQVTVDESTKNLAITGTTPAATITVPRTVTDATLNVAQLLTPPAAGAETVTSSPLPTLTVAANTAISASKPVEVVIPAGTTVSASVSDNWDGTINVPTVKANNTITVTPDAGKTATVNTVIEVGYGDIPLTFSQAVRLLIPGQAGRDVGYVRKEVFTPITTVLTSDSGDSLPDGGDGKIDVGSDLVIWTKHFTSFVTYTQNTISSSGGGGSSTPQAVTSTTGAASVNPKAGGTIGLGSNAVVEIPANALQGTSALEVKVQKSTSPPAAPANATLASDVYEFSVGGQSQYRFAKSVTLKLSFNPALIGANENPAIHYYDESLSKWVNTGGTVSGSNISAAVDHFTKFAVLATEKTGVKEPQPEKSGKMINLNDINGHWAEKTIKEMVAAGAIGGFPDGSFKPNNCITRAEFAGIVVRAFKLEPKTGKVFSDTASHWAQDSIATAAAYGIVSGYNDTTFGPNDNITREQMAAMIVKAAQLTEVAQGKSFADSHKVSAWAKQAVATASHHQVIGGYPDNTFRPQAGATRAEAATVIVKALR